MNMMFSEGSRFGSFIVSFGRCVGFSYVVMGLLTFLRSFVVGGARLGHFLNG